MEKEKRWQGDNSSSKNQTQIKIVPTMRHCLQSAELPSVSREKTSVHHANMLQVAPLGEIFCLSPNIKNCTAGFLKLQYMKTVRRHWKVSISCRNQNRYYKSSPIEKNGIDVEKRANLARHLSQTWCTVMRNSSEKSEGTNPSWVQRVFPRIFLRYFSQMLGLLSKTVLMLTAVFENDFCAK